MKKCLVRKEALLKAIKLMAAMGGNYFNFKAGMMTASAGDELIVCAKTDLVLLTGTVDSKIFQKSIKSIERDYFEMGIMNGQYSYESRETRFKIKYLPLFEEFSKVNLWDPGIKWVKCPTNLFTGIQQALSVATNIPFSYKEELVYVSNKYVAGIINNIFVRYRLRSFSPFDLIFSKDGIQKILPQIKALRLIRAAKYSFEKAGAFYSGVALDFGDIRIWLSEEDQEEDNESDDDFNEPITREMFYSNQWASDFKKQFLAFNSIFDTPTSFLVKLPADAQRYLKVFKKLMAHPRNDARLEIVVLNKGRGELRVDFEKKGSGKSVSIPVIIYGHLRPVSFRLNFLNFYNAVKGGCFIGYIDLMNLNESDIDFLYLRDRRCEYLIGVEK